MEYLSQLLGKPILDVDEERFGTIAEVVIRPHQPVPIVAAFQVKTEDGALFLPYSSLLMDVSRHVFHLRTRQSAIQPYMPQPEDFSLVRDVLDKQIVDIHDYRVVRVNDIRLAPIQNGTDLALVGVDTGWHGLVRRMGLETAVDGLSRLFHVKTGTQHFIPWNDVESLPTHNAGDPIKLKFSHEKLAKLHPADIGNILNQLDPADRHEVLDTLDVETAADALAEAEEDVQISTLNAMDADRAADLLEEMPADEAADVLKDLGAERREAILERMDAEISEDVRELLSYHDETAGGLMTNEFVAIDTDLTAAQTIDHLRSLCPDAETIYYIYVTDLEEHLRGVISLRDLIIAQPETKIVDFMITNVRLVHVDATIEEVAHLFERYKLLALPVVDNDNKLLGIITVDDTLEQILPDGWRRRSNKRADRDHPASSTLK